MCVYLCVSILSAALLFGDQRCHRSCQNACLQSASGLHTTSSRTNGYTPPTGINRKSRITNEFFTLSFNFLKHSRCECAQRKRARKALRSGPRATHRAEEINIFHLFRSDVLVACACRCEKHMSAATTKNSKSNSNCI